MAKRFTDTNKYKKPFIRSLPGAYKLLWDFLYHDCDHSGIWIVDFEIAQMYIGKDMPVNYHEALQFFNCDDAKVVVLDNGKKWFIPSFIEFQYGELRDNNKAHVAVINTLNKYGLLQMVRVGYSDPVNNNIKGEKRLELFKEWDYTCCYCDNTFSVENLQPDHVIPLNKNGTNSKSNIVCSCKDCNRKKSDKNLFEFILINNLNKDLILKKMSFRGIQAPKEGAKDKDIDKDKDKDIEKGVQGEKQNPLQNSNLFRQPKIPTLEDVQMTFLQFGGTKEMAEAFFNKHSSTGWFLNSSPIINFKSLVGSFIHNWQKNNQNANNKRNSKPDAKLGNARTPI